MTLAPIFERLSLPVNWQPACLQQTLELSQNECHLWKVPLSITSAEQTMAKEWLSPKQRSKFDKRTAAGYGEPYLAGRFYLLSILALYEQCQPNQIKLSYTRLDKPYLSGKENHIHFNLSDTTQNSANNALIVVCKSKEVGVDLEPLQRSSNFSGIAKKRFTAAENRLITDQNGDIDPKAFLCLWTRKEASGKATGQGINFNMQNRELIDGYEPTVNYRDENDRRWRLVQLRISRSLIGCIAHAGHTPLKLKTFIPKPQA